MIRFATIPCLVAICLLPAVAQEPRGPLTATYKVEYHIRDGSDASAEAGRRYTIWIDSHGKGTFRVSERVPVASGSQSGGGPVQFQYYDTGVNIDTNIYEQESKIGINASLDLSLLSRRADGLNVAPNPTVSQLRISINALVSPNKPALVASIDD